ncbi:hypothetical protein QQP08_015711, partial [Theobroma cacao]
MSVESSFRLTFLLYGYKRPRNPRVTPHQQSLKLSHHNVIACTESGDPDGENNEHSKPEKRQNPDGRKSEVISCELSRMSSVCCTSDLDELNGVAEENASSNSNVISSCSNEDIGNECTAGNSEGTMEILIMGAYKEVLTQHLLKVIHLKSSLEADHVVHNKDFEDGLQKELVHNAAVGVVLKSTNGVESES